MEHAGFFGKLPSNGDFVSRRLSRDFLEVWDQWLQRCVAESKATLGDNWLSVYLTSPLWRFAMTPGVCGDAARIGVLMPSVDRVGRYFPLSVVVSAPETTSPLGLANDASEWFEKAEALLISVLAENAPPFETFDRSVKSLVLDPLSLAPVSASTAPDATAGSWRLPIPTDVTLGTVICQLADKLLFEQARDYSIWWTMGSENVAPVLLAMPSLPDPSQYTAMLSDRDIPKVWERLEPDLAADEPLGVATISLEDLINSPVNLTYTSATKTTPGKVRRKNEDAVLDRRTQGFWMVADGMGGHADGKTASAALVSEFNLLELPDELDGRIQAVTRAMQSVNKELRDYAQDHPESKGLGSTVAAFFVAGNAGAVVWVGDTRVYRKRGNRLEPLTLDHSERQELLERGDIASILGPTNVVTRAVGGEETLQVSTIRQTMQPGDRYLLCSDGVYDDIPVHELAVLLEEPNCQKTCDAIINRVNEGRAEDNATALIIDVAKN